MKNPVLDAVKKSAVMILNSSLGFCGLADGPEFAILNSTLPDGRDVTITIKVDKPTASEA